MLQNTTLLNDRGFLALSGEACHTFLQGLVTCNIQALAHTPLLYGAHLTHQGRLLYDFFVFEHGSKLILDCHKKTLMDFAKSLHHYQMHFDITYEDLSAEFTALALKNTPKTAKELGPAYIFDDPRHPQLGQRAYLINKPNSAAHAPTQEYHQMRIKLGIPDVAYDCVPGKTILSELGLEFLGAVDYKKGCYLGQEMTARTYYRSPPKKRPIQFTYAPEYTLAHGATVKAGNLAIGQVFSTNQGQGIAVVRVQKAFSKTPLTVEGIKIKPKKPEWANYSVE